MRAREASLHDAIGAAEERGDLDRVNQLEARLWLDGPDAPEGRVGGDVRRLFLEMNGRALRAEPPGPERDTPNAFDRLQEIHAPVHVVLGELDQSVIRARGHALVERIPRSTLSTIAGVAHLPPLERPDAFAREVLGHRGESSGRD